jgi:hypothetical protein
MRKDVANPQHIIVGCLSKRISLQERENIGLCVYANILKSIIHR